jgi:PAS domain S-box-containing protein
LNLNPPQRPASDSLRGGSAMSRRIQQYDWSSHPLGPLDGWPRGLTHILQIVLTSRYPMWIGWGPELHFFHNDAYARTLGAKENWALGEPATKVWSEAWPVIGPRTESVLRTGNATHDESLLLLLERNGYREETYHTFSLSPVPDDNGSVGGVLCVTTEDTEHVVTERRLALPREFASDLTVATTEDALFRALERRLAERPHDVPFAVVYLFESDSSTARLACRHGTGSDPKLAPELIVTDAPSQSWPAGTILEHGSPIVIDDLSGRFGSAPTGPWDKPPHQAIVAPLVLSSRDNNVAGFFVAGLNPYRRIDAVYRSFIDSLAGQIARGLSTCRVHEVTRERTVRAPEIDPINAQFFHSANEKLRTPLTLMLAPIHELLNTPVETLPAGMRDRLNLVHRNGLRFLKLANAVLDFVQIGTDRRQVQFQPIDLAAYTNDIATSFRSTIERGGLKLNVDCPPLPEPVHVDPELWEKIVLSLLSNAFKFTREGEIRVALRPVVEGVELSVQDSGPGIPKAAQSQLFSPFHRVPGAPGRTDDGVGIGLAVVRALVTLHGGSVSVKSEPDVGSTFNVTLPTGRSARRKDSAKATSHPPPISAAAATLVDEAEKWKSQPTTGEGLAIDREQMEQPAAPAGKVLVIDGSADMRQYLGRLLSARFEVQMAADGRAALEMIQAQKPDLVLCDTIIPNFDGIRLLRAIRSRAELRSIPVVLLSSRADERSRIEALDAGADDVVVKPFSARELLARVNVHLLMARVRGQAEQHERELRTNAELLAEALRENTERFSASLAAAGTGTFRWDLRTNMLDFDESRNRLFGLAGGEKALSSAEFIQHVHADDRSRVQAACERSMKQGAGFDLEYRVPLRDGSIRWLHDKGRTFFDDDGEATYLIGACVDITRRKQVEAFVWRQKDVLEQIVQGASLRDVLETLTLDVEQIAPRKQIAVVMMADADGRHLRPVAGRRSPPGWNELIDGVPVGLTAGSSAAAADQKTRVIVRDVMTSRIWEKYRTEAIRRGLRACWSTPIISSRGHVLGTFDVYYADPLVPSEDEIRLVDIVTRTAAIAVERDRSEAALKESQAQLAGHAHRLEERVRERTAKLQETVSELESFSYSISHDMRAPLRAMQSFAELLAADCGANIGPEGKDYIRRIIGASARMDRLIQDVLTYSRVSRTELPLEPVDIEKLIDGILESYPHFQPPHAKIEVQRPLPRVIGNEAALVQCLSNLVGNAIKFVAPGVVPRVQIWAETIGSRVRLCVRDNGIGIEPDAHENIFRIFYQLDRSYEGTGIGLSVVRKAAERMGGSVGLKSELHRGSTFHLELNLAN